MPQIEAIRSTVRMGLWMAAMTTVPLALILLGVWVLGGRYLPHSRAGGETFSIDLQGATRLDLDVDHGAGSISFSGGALTGVALSGS
ncbi:MAG: hypothetical protein WCJ30_27175, partial [Deltaproteobacteria bacterium]